MKPRTVNVDYIPGDLVWIDHTIPGHVASVSISNTLRIRYECVWWNNGTRHEMYLDGYELKPRDDSRDDE